MTMTGQSFGRVVKVRVFATILGQSAGVPTISYNNGYTEFSSVLPDGSSGFRIKGKVTMVQPTVQFNTNQVNLSLYNLGPNSRALIQSKVGTRIGIIAGYGSGPKQIALADILWARTHKEGPDYITEIIAGDAHFGLTNGTINQSFSGAVTNQQIVNALLTALEEQQIFSGVITGIPAGNYANNGFVLSGSPLVILSDVCRKMGLSMNVVGSMVNILPIGQDSGAPLIELSVATGLIGIPEVAPPGIIGVQDLSKSIEVSPSNDISFKTLLRPEISLSQKVRITSKFVNGEYIVGRAVHDFDSWEGPFYTECQAFKVVTTSG
jgi:hypothetical protein